MGQRHQVYIAYDNGENLEPIAAYHLQWLFGMKAVSNLSYFVKIVQGLGYSNLRDVRELDSIIKHVYGLGFNKQTVKMVHNVSEDLIKNNKFIEGDNNDGATLIILNGKGIRNAGFFTFDCCEGEHFNGSKLIPVTSKKYLSFYYNKKQQETFDFRSSFKYELKLINSIKFKNITKKQLKELIE